METNSGKGGFFKGMLTALLLIAVLLGGIYCVSKYSEAWGKRLDEKAMPVYGGAATNLEATCHE